MYVDHKTAWRIDFTMQRGEWLEKLERFSYWKKWKIKSQLLTAE